MSHRAILAVIETEPSVFNPHWDQLAARSLHGALSSGDSTRKALFNPAWLRAISSARLSQLLVGQEWLDAAPARFRSIAVSDDAAGWRCMPASTKIRVERMFDDAKLKTDSPSPLRRIAAAAVLAENEPWDFLALSLPIPSGSSAGDVELVARGLASFLARQPADIASAVLLLAGESQSRWLLHTPSVAPATADGHPAQDVVATVLGWLNVEPPADFKGKSIELAAQAPNVYSADDEKEIQKRLEDLGYL